MLKLSGLGNLNKWTQQVNLTSADQQSSAPLVAMGASSMAPGECSTSNCHWGYFPTDFRSMAQTRDMSSNWESSSTPMPQHFNSHRNSGGDVGDGALSSEPNPTQPDLVEPRVAHDEHVNSQLEKPGAPSQACIGKKRKEPDTDRVLKKREADRKYRADIKSELMEYRRMKPENERLREVISSLGGIDQVELQMNHMKSELHRLQQKEEDYDLNRQLFDTGLNRLEQMKSKYGGIKEMESMLDKFKEFEANSNRLELMKSKYGGIDRMESMLDRFVQMEAESHKLNQIKSTLGIQETESILQKFREMEDELYRLDQIKSSFGGIDDIVPGMNRLKKIELQFEKHNQTVNQKEQALFHTSPDSPQEKGRSQLLDLNGGSDKVYGWGLIPISFTTESESESNMHYSDVLVDRLIARLTDEDDASKWDTNSFKDLLNGVWERVNKFEVPSALVSTSHNIFKLHGDIAKNCKLGAVVSNTIFTFLCAAIKVMGDLSLDQVTEEIILKLRDPIMDAKRSNFDVEFAMEYLKTIAHGYFGLKARRDCSNLKRRVASLRVAEEALRKKLEETSREINAAEAKLRDLRSEKCRICQESANKIICKIVSVY